ncbi:MAG: hypothetical protein ACKN8Y_03440, partial [Polynucleobacter victoriensis]
AIAPTFSKSRVKVINANLKACFPNLSEAERDQLAKQHWRLLGRSFAERGRLWLGSPQSKGPHGVKIELIAENPDFENIIVDPRRDEITVEGLAVGLIRPGGL